MATGDRRPEGLEALRRGLGALEPPAGMQRRVGDRLQGGGRPVRRRKPLRLALILIPATALAAGTYSHLRTREAAPLVPVQTTPAPAKRAPPALVMKQAPPARATPAVVSPKVPSPKKAAPRPNPRRRRKRRAPSDLAAQVTAYRAALSQKEPATALSAFRAMRRRWPRGAMSHEVDLRIVEALIKLDRAGDARAEARRFLARHPRSPQRAKVEAVLGGGPDQKK